MPVSDSLDTEMKNPDKKFLAGVVRWCLRLESVAERCKNGIPGYAFFRREI